MLLIGILRFVNSGFGIRGSGFLITNHDYSNHLYVELYEAEGRKLKARFVVESWDCRIVELGWAEWRKLNAEGLDFDYQLPNHNYSIHLRSVNQLSKPHSGINS